MKRKGLAAMLAVALSCTVMLSACGTKDKSQGNAEEPTARQEASEEERTEPLELHFARLCWTGAFENSADMWKWKDYAQKTNINVVFEEYPITNYAEKLQIQLTTGDLPDAYYQMIFSTDQLYENGQNGNLIPLNDLIEEHAPNIKKLFDENPAIRKAVTMPDGNIYSLPYVSLDKMSASVRTYVNQEMAEELGMEMPTTIDELTAFMKAMKEKYPDSYPFTLPTGNQGIMENTFAGAWGLGNTGVQGMGMHVDLDENGKVRFYKTSDAYRQMLKQFAQWYQNGLIHPEFFTTLDVATFQNLGAENKVGVFCWVVPSYIGDPEVYRNFRGISQFKGPQGDQIMSWIDADVRGIWSFMITKENEHPAETMQWVDYWYSDEGGIYKMYGTEGVTYAKGTSGVYEYIGDAKAAYDKGELHTVLGHYGGYEPGVEGSEAIQAVGDGFIDPADETTTMEYFYGMDDLEEYKKYIPADVWPAFTATEEEAEELAVILPEITTYLDEMRDKFITGIADLDKDWETYVNTLEKMGADRYLEIRQTQYDRYCQ